jgi:hypothetical protein
VANQAFLDLRNQTVCMANPFGMEPWWSRQGFAAPALTVSAVGVGLF